MNRLVLWVVLFLCATLQAVLPAWEGMGQAKAPLLLCAVLYYALSRDSLQVIEAAVLAGILQDSLGPIPHGFSVLTFVGIGLLVHHYREHVFADHWFTHLMIGGGAAVMVTMSLYVLLVGIGARNGVSFAFVMTKSLGMSMLAMMIAPLAYKGIERLDRAVGNVSRRRA